MLCTFPLGLLTFNTHSIPRIRHFWKFFFDFFQRNGQTDPEITLSSCTVPHVCPGISSIISKQSSLEVTHTNQDWSRSMSQLNHIGSHLKSKSENNHHLILRFKEQLLTVFWHILFFFASLKIFVLFQYFSSTCNYMYNKILPNL